MPRTTSFTLGDEQEAFLRAQVESGKVSSVSEAVRALIEEKMEDARKEEWLVKALQEAEASGDYRSHDEVWAALEEEFPWIK